MTTLALKTVVANKIIASADAALGEHTIKSGRYWYKGQQNCDLVIYRKGKNTIIHASGGVRFRIVVSRTQGKEASGSLGLLGWLRETPNAIRIVLTLLSSYSHNVIRRRELRLALEHDSEERGEEMPELTEAIGTHFSIKADEDKLEEKDRISFAESDRNFDMAIKSRWYHQGFVNFCRVHDIKCYYRSVFAEPDHEAMEIAVRDAAWAQTLQ